MDVQVYTSFSKHIWLKKIDLTELCLQSKAVCAVWGKSPWGIIKKSEYKESHHSQGD